MSRETDKAKAELCVAIVRKQYEGRSRPRVLTIENEAVELMSRSDAELVKLAQKLGVEIPPGALANPAMKL